VANSSAEVKDPGRALKSIAEAFKLPEVQPNYTLRRSLQLAGCTVNAWNVIITLGNLVMNSRALNKVCSETVDTKEVRNVCTVLGAGNVGLWASLGSNILGMLLNCPGAYSKEASCAFGPIGLLGTGSAVTAGAAALEGNCKQFLKDDSAVEEEVDVEEVDTLNRSTLDTLWNGRLRDERDGDVAAYEKLQRERKRWLGYQLAIGDEGAVVRRLQPAGAAPFEAPSTPTGHLGAIGDFMQEAEKLHQEVKEKKEEWQAEESRKKDEEWAIAACVFNTQGVVAWTLRAAVTVGLAAIDCTEDNIGEQGKLAKKLCAMDISIAVASTAIAANLMIISSINCPHTLEYMPDRLCASGVLSVIAGSATLGVGFASVNDACSGIQPPKIDSKGA